MELDKWNSVPDSIFNSIVTQIDSFLGSKELSPTPEMSPEAQISLLQQLHDLYSEIEAVGGRRPAVLADENRTLLDQIRSLKQQIEGFQAAIGTKRPVVGGDASFDGDGSLQAQLASLYQEIEQSGGHRPLELAAMCDQLVEQLKVLYQEIEDANGLRLDEAKKVIGSLVEQLHSLYEDRELAPVDAKVGSSATNAPSADVASSEQQSTIDSLVAQLHSLYQEKEHDLSESTIESFNEQLCSLYEEKELTESMVSSLVAQLEDLYAEREQSFQTQVMIESFVAQLEDLYKDREDSLNFQSTIDSFGAQLNDLYAEKEEREALWGAVSGCSESQAAELFQSVIEQLKDLYAEKEDGSHLSNVVSDLAEQIDVFVEEKLELEAEVAELKSQLVSVRERARRMTAALTESALT